MLGLILMKKVTLGRAFLTLERLEKLISSGNISSSEEMIMSADNINACRTEGHGKIDHGVDENHLGEEIISNNQQSLNSR